MRIGLVLAAGGSVGVAYHGAALAALAEATGWDPRDAEVIVGTSAGSITAAMLRSGAPAADLVSYTEGLPLSREGQRLAQIGRPHRPRPRLRDALAFRPVADLPAVAHALTCPRARPSAGLIAAALPRGGIPTGAISLGINSLYQGTWPARALWICAVDLRSGERVVFGKPGGPLAEVGSAVAASSAIPAYFRPVRIGGRYYVDGGVHSMVNLDLLADVPLDLVVVSSPLSVASAWSVIGTGALVRQAVRAQLRWEVAALRRKAGVAVVAIEPGGPVLEAMGLNPMDASRRTRVSRATGEAVRRWLSEDIQGQRLAAALAAAGRRASVSPERRAAHGAGGAPEAPDHRGGRAATQRPDAPRTSLRHGPPPDRASRG